MYIEMKEKHADFIEELANEVKEKLKTICIYEDEDNMRTSYIIAEKLFEEELRYAMKLDLIRRTTKLKE